MQTWQGILGDATEVARDAQILLLIGAWLLGLAVASLAVLVGGRMADQSRRVGLLKAAGGTPGLVAAVLLAEYVLVAVVAAAAGLAVGWLTAPLLAGSSAGLIGSAGTPSMTVPTVALVFAVALGVAVVATVVPAVRAARSSTVGALADAARTPRRVGWLIAVSARLPVPLLLALRVAARRPRRAVLSVVGVAVTVSGIFVVLVLDAFLAAQPSAGGYDSAQVAALRRVLLVWLVVLLCLAAVNAVFITWATVLDNRHGSALARALGATPGEVSAAMAAAQVLPALVGAVLGVFPGGFALFAAINAITGGDSDRAALPSFWQLLALVLATVLVVAALTAVPARLGGRRPVTETLQAELATR
jgi:ABC-type lipoprotein release transport system permease subunit